MEKSTTTTSKQWLQRLKDESWEAELLVSAVAIFGTFKLFGVIDWLTNKFIDILDPNLYLTAYAVVFFGLFAISILASMFVIHFFLRAYWIGLVGLNSVFPDYSIEDSAYSKIYTEKILSILPKLKDSIEKVDELCSVIFSAAFTFLLIYSNFALIATIYIILFNLLSSIVPPMVLLIPLIFLLSMVFLQSGLSIYANLKMNHEKEELQNRSFQLNKISSMILFGPLYKAILQVSMIFTSNFKKKKRLSYLMIIFVSSGAFVALFQMGQTNIPYLINSKKYFSKTKVESSFYEINNDENLYLLTPEIKSDIINSNTIKVFIPLYSHERKQRIKICDHNLKDATEQQEDERLLYCYKEYVKIKVNEQPIDVEFLRYIHQRTDQFGVVGYIVNNNLKPGKNSLTVAKGNGNSWKIPFYFQK
ncbi:6TM ABC transporter family protein [Tenacibaculum agarivorans]|uniref:hypothetical protein n=1 Tax=Tenacibaculum agarivorans TaxID=1908389 RepID=UPI00094B7FC1|nr:hypothetical protein [Tenacibaculum agarivorans]